MGRDFINRRQFTISGKKVTVYPCNTTNRPVIYLNTFFDEGENIYKILLNSGCADFTLVSIGELNWDHDMAPWSIPPITQNDTPCTGGADKYLAFLSNEIVAEAEQSVQSISWRGIAGYSLAGLFAIYALYKTDIFTRASSMSGSLWFPKFKEYVFSNEMKVTPEKIYFSLGDKECKTNNPYLKMVQQNTEAIQTFYCQNGIDTVFQLNSGVHHQDEAARIAAGIKWLLEE